MEIVQHDVWFGSYVGLVNIWLISNQEKRAKFVDKVKLLYGLESRQVLTPWYAGTAVSVRIWYITRIVCKLIYDKVQENL